MNTTRWTRKFVSELRILFGFSPDPIEEISVEPGRSCRSRITKRPSSGKGGLPRHDPVVLNKDRTGSIRNPHTDV